LTCVHAGIGQVVRGRIVADGFIDFFRHIDLRACVYMYKRDRCKRLKIFIRSVLLFIGGRPTSFSRQWEIYRPRRVLHFSSGFVYMLKYKLVRARVCVCVRVWYISWFRRARQWFDNGSEWRFMARIIEERKTVWNTHAFKHSRIICV